MGLPSSVDGVTKLVGADAGTVGARTGGHPRRLTKLVRVLEPGLLGGVGGRVCGILSDLLYVLDGIRGDLGHLLAHMGGGRADPLLLDAGSRQQRSNHEPCGSGADRQPKRVFLSYTDHPLGAVLSPACSISGRTHDGVLRRGELAGDRVLLLRHRVLHAPRDVGLVRERGDGVAHPLAGVLYLSFDCARVFAHWMSSLTDCLVRSGIGTPVSFSSSRPRNASSAAAAAYRTVVTRLASHSGIARSSKMMTVAIEPPTTAIPSTAAPPNMPTPSPAFLPFSVISPRASSISWRTSSEMSRVSSLTSSGTDSCRF